MGSGGLAPMPVATAADDRAGTREQEIGVLLLIDSLGMGGAERLVASLAARAPSAGMRVEVVALNDGQDGRAHVAGILADMGVRTEFLGIPRLASRVALPATYRAVRRSGCQIVHAHLEYAATLGVPAGRLAGVPVVCTFHQMPQRPSSPREALREWLAVVAASQGKRTVFVSDAARAAFTQHYRRWSANWTVVRNGVDLTAFHPSREPWPDDLGPAPDGPVVLLPAVMREGKGHEQLLQAWPRVLAAAPGARLVLAGSGPEEPGLRAMASGLGADGSVIFPGFRTDVDRLMRASDVVALPSLGEALPTVLMEAAACGLPVVATAVGGTTEVVDDGRTGLLVAPGDVDGLAEALRRLLGDGGLRRRMGAAARGRAEADFGLDQWVASLRAVYEEAMGTSPPS